MHERPLLTFTQTLSCDLRLIRINPARSAQTPRRRRIYLGSESGPGYNEGPDARGPVLMHAGKVSSRRGRSAHICADQDYVIIPSLSLSLSFCPFIFLILRQFADRFADFHRFAPSIVNLERAIAVRNCTKIRRRRLVIENRSYQRCRIYPSNTYYNFNESLPLMRPL